MKSHDTFLELAAAAIDFELTGAERGRLESHLAACAACVREAAALHADARSLAALPTVRLSERRADELLASALHPGVVRQPLRLLAVAALVGLLLVGSLVVGSELLRRAQDDDLSVVVPVPSASVAPDAPTWAKATVPATEGEGRWSLHYGGVASGQTGFVAFGHFSCRNDETDCRISMMSSADGVAWTPAPPQASLATAMIVPTSGPESGVIDVAWGPAGWVAIGRVGDPTMRIALWTSSDGMIWERLPADASFDDTDPKAIAADSDGYVIVGTDLRQSNDLANGHAYAASWTSPDGRAWARAAEAPVLDAGGFCDTMEWPGYGGMNDVVALDDGGFLAVGTRVTGSAGVGEQCPWSTVAWRSPDGIAWQQISSFPALEAWGVDVASDGHRLAAVTGCADPSCATVMTSDDGVSWGTRLGPEDAIVSDVAIDGDDVILVGPNGIGRISSKIWRLVPGGDWAAEDLPGVPVGNVQAVSIDARDGIVGVVGWAEAYDEGEPPSFAFVRR